ncbi:MAG: PH domain-containing protein [Synergistaceae bacterium]|jgi:membrane protein YdbS with pleckstrin-like domain|nr:PH domain-containing protein [Synergistaceae bacterium]
MNRTSQTNGTKAFLTPISSLLEDGESVQHRTGRHPASLLPFAAIALILLIPTYGISLILLIPPLIKMMTCDYVITNKRILARQGIWGRNLVEVPLCEIFEVCVGESIVSAKFGMGRIELKDDHQTISFKEIKRPDAFISSIMRARTEEAA